MPQNKEFGVRLSEGIVSVAKRQGKTIREVEEEIAEALGYGRHNIQRWRRGYVPNDFKHIEFIACYCVKFGRLNRDWSDSFLTQAYYPKKKELLEELFPNHSQLVKPPTPPKPILPPRYGDFFGRQNDMDRVLEGLASREPLILLEGIGGIGKTTLAIEVAHSCLPGGKAKLDHPFHTCIFIAAKEPPVTLDDLLNTIARAFNYPYLIQETSRREKRNEVDRLLGAQRVLLIVDNFETVTDKALVKYLQEIPEPSKAIITTRHGQLIRAWDVPLDGLAKPEALELIRRHARRLKLLTIAEATNDKLEPLVAVTDGNPYALQTALGYLRYGRLALDTLVNALHHASHQVEEIFEYILNSSWQVLDQNAQYLLMVMPLFVDSATKAAIGRTAGVEDPYLDAAIEQLVEMSLLKVNDALEENHRRYTFHPLARAFASRKRLLPEVQEWVFATHNRWLEWAAEFASSKVGWCWDDQSKLDILEPEERNIYAAIEWAARHQDNYAINDLIIRIASGVDHYYYVRGPWKKKMAVDQMRIKAAQHLGRFNEEARALAQHIQLLCTKGDPEAAKEYLPLLNKVKQSKLDKDVFTQVQHAYAFYAMAHREFDKAGQLLEQCISEQCEHAEQQVSPNLAIATLHWLATCFYRKGLLADAERIFREALEQAIKTHYQRSMIYCRLSLGEIYLEQGKFESADSFLMESLKEARSLKELRYTAQIQRARVRLYIKHEDYSVASIAAASVALAEAKELFEWLGLKDEQEILKQAQELLESKS